MTTIRNGALYRFDDLTLDLGKYHLTRGDEAIRLGKLTFELLRVLVEAAPNAVSHEEIFEGVWGPGKVASPETLSQRVMLLRRALQDHPEQPRYIEVIRGQGYRIIPPVNRLTPPPEIPGDEPSNLGFAGTGSRRLRPVVVAGLLLTAGLMGWVLYLGNDPVIESTKEIVRFEFHPPEEHPLALRFFARDIAISRDGEKFAYSSTGGSIIVRPLDGLDVTRLSNLGPVVHNVAFSPDGDHLAFLTGGSLRAVSVDGGPVQVIADVGQYTEGDIEWTDHGFFLVANPRGLLRVPLDDSEHIDLLISPDTGSGERAFGSPTLLPDGRTVVFVVEPIRPGEQRRIEAYDLVTGIRKGLAIGGARPRYLTSGLLVAAFNGELRALPFDIEKREIAGEPITLGTSVTVNLNGTANFAIAQNGTLIYVPNDSMGPARSLVWVSRDGDEELIPAPPNLYSYPRLSSDGGRIALDVRWPESDIWIWDIHREVFTRVTNDPAENALPTWHPSGDSLAFSDGRNGTLDIFSAELRDGGVTELVTGVRREMPVEYSADKRFLLYGEDQPLGYWTAMVLNVESGERWPWLSRDYQMMNPTFSPNGEWITYSSQESGQSEVYVRPFANPWNEKWQVSRNGGVKPIWSRDGKEIFYVSLDSQLMSAQVSQEPTFEPGPVTHLFDASLYVGRQLGTGGRPYDLSLDGERFLMTRRPSADEDSAWNAHLVVVLNALQQDHDSLLRRD